MSVAAVKLHPIEELLAQVEDGQLRVGLAVGVLPPLVQQVEQGVLGGILVLSPLGELGAGATDVCTPPATVEERLRTTRHGRFLQTGAFGESVSRGGGCVLIGVGPAGPSPPLLYPFHPVLSGEKWQRKVARGEKPTFENEQGSPQLLVLVSLASCRGERIRTSDLLNPIIGVEAGSSRRMSQVEAF